MALGRCLLLCSGWQGVNVREQWDAECPVPGEDVGQDPAAPHPRALLGLRQHLEMDGLGMDQVKPQ